MRLRRHAPVLAALLATLMALALVTRLQLSPDVADLLPEAGEGAALRDYVRVFGRGDLALVLVRGADSGRVQQATDAAVEALRQCEVVRAAVDRMRVEVPRDPSLAWTVAAPRGRAKLRAALEPEGMRERLADSKRLLLAPGAASLSSSLRTDPLRLRQLPFEQVRLGPARTSAHDALGPEPSGALVADGGRARLILLSAHGQVLRGNEARAFTTAVARSLDPIRARYPDVRIELTGGHAIAADTEKALRRDLVLSGVLSTLLAALAFALTFRRLRALVAVLPPLALGTLWTAAAAGLAFQRVSALTLGFLAVVVGVGLDTGIHVYASLLDARRRGLTPSEAAAHARSDTARPTLVAALTAAIAFGTLALSSVPALRQFGVLCAAGELLTALAILALTPAIGGWLERSSPPPPPNPRWIGWLDRMRRHHAAPILLGIGVFVPISVLFTLGPPSLNDKLVGIRPGNLPSIEVHEAVTERFGGGVGQWVVLLRDSDPERVRARADHVFEALDAAAADQDALDGLTRFAPSLETQRARLLSRNELNLPARASALRAMLSEEGFEPSAFSAAIASFEHPSAAVHDVLSEPTDANRLLRARYLAQDGNTAWAALYVRPRPGREQAITSVVQDADPEATITGYARLESALAHSLGEDLPRILWASALLVFAVLLLTLRRGRDVLIAMGVLAFELLWVVALVRWLPLPIHLYNAFVLPVLLGITVDEVMFLLHRARGPDQGVSFALRREGPNVMATGLTTAAGFSALCVCSFQGLRDMGVLGTIGVLAGLVAALVIVPVVLSPRRH